MTNYRCVAIDVDGTMLQSDHQLSETVRRTVRELRAQGIHICVATGKLFAAIDDLVATFGLTGPQITGNGAVITEAETGNVLTCTTLTPAEIDLIWATMARYAPGIPLAWYTVDAIFTDAPPGPLDDILEQYHEPRVQHVERLDVSLPPPIKILFSASHAVLDELRQTLAPHLHGQVRLTRTATDFLEFQPLTTHKGQALAQVMALCGYTAAEVVAIGDGENDLTLIETAGMGVAMGNAIPALQQRAQMITATNDDDGVAVALRQLFPDELARIGTVER